MPEKQPRSRRPVCPKCHLPIAENDVTITYRGRRYHKRCAPAPAEKHKRHNQPFTI